MTTIRQWVAFTCVLVSGAVHAVDFQRDVRPILAGHCFKCHGPYDKARKAKLRLDMRPEQDVLKEILLRIDHTTQQTFAGHVCRLIDDKTNRALDYFIAPKALGKLILKN